MSTHAPRFESLSYLGTVTNKGLKATKLCSDPSAIFAVSAVRDGGRVPLDAEDINPSGSPPEYSLVKRGGVLAIDFSSLVASWDGLRLQSYHLKKPGKYSVTFEYRCGQIRLQAPPVDLVVTE